MKIIIVGNLGYVGPVVSAHLRKALPTAEIIGFDIGYFSGCMTDFGSLPEVSLNAQHFGDIRKFPVALLDGADCVINLAAISNDPMGNQFEKPTLQINYTAGLELARAARAAGVRKFIFASSCSVYGFSEDGSRTEESAVDPLTAYAKSKVLSEQGLCELAGGDFQVTCLRFATACGWSPRLRLDLVLNDFVANSIAVGNISILSDGTPWRPLIHVNDMARAIEWSVGRSVESGGERLIVNVGSDEWNYQVKDLAAAVSGFFPGMTVSTNKNAPPDRRSYRVSFAKYASLAPGHQPQVSLPMAIEGLKEGLGQMKFADPDFRSSYMIRLNILRKHLANNRLDANLSWSI